jgi:hypothetical protein
MMLRHVNPERIHETNEMPSFLALKSWRALFCSAASRTPLAIFSILPMLRPIEAHVLKGQ